MYNAFHSQNQCNDLIDREQIQKLVNNWLVATSFSIGVADTVADTETIMTIGSIIDTAKRQANVSFLR